MQIFFYLGFLVIGFVQLFAIMDGFTYATGFSGFISFLVAIMTTYIPLVGSALGVYGAYNVWNWEILQAVALFFWYVPVFLIYLAIAFFSDNN